MAAITEAQQRAHDAAVAAGDSGYIDPETGLFVMSELYHRERGSCCESVCRHCPYRDWD